MVVIHVFFAQGDGNVLAEALVGKVVRAVVVVVVRATSTGDNSFGSVVPTPADLTGAILANDLDPDTSVVLAFGHHERWLYVDTGTISWVLGNDVIGPIGRPIRDARLLLGSRREPPFHAIGHSRQVLDFCGSSWMVIFVGFRPRLLTMWWLLLKLLPLLLLWQ